MNQQTNNNKIVVVIDPCTTGYNVALEIYRRGYQVIALWSSNLKITLRSCNSSKLFGNMNYVAEVEEKKTLEKTKKMLQQIAAINNKEGCKESSIVALLAGAETGVPLSDSLSEYMGLRSNGTLLNGSDRRDKYIQQELTRQAGVRAVWQISGTRFSPEVQSFLKTKSYPVIIKPNEGSGSDGVKLCSSFQEAKDHFNLLLGSDSCIANKGYDTVLCQEYLSGKEYVVDHVSRDSVHKTAMVWVYDKGPANGANFVLFGMKPVDPTSDVAIALINYTRNVLDAISFANGPSHTEVMMTPDGPCLVEVNCRACGISGIWIPVAEALTGGYSQVDMTADAFLDSTAWLNIPDKPAYPSKSSGQNVMLVSYSEGTVESTPGIDKIRQLPSFVALDTDIEVGDSIQKTTQLCSLLGIVALCNEDAEMLEKDVRFIRSMENQNDFFIYSAKDGKEDDNNNEDIEKN